MEFDYLFDLHWVVVVVVLIVVVVAVAVDVCMKVARANRR